MQASGAEPQRTPSGEGVLQLEETDFKVIPAQTSMLGWLPSGERAWEPAVAQLLSH